MTCKHEQIRTWIFEDTEQPADMWSCVKCGLKFEPINQRQPWVGLTDVEREFLLHQALRFYDTNAQLLSFIKTVEAKLKQKNGYAEEKNT